MHKSQKKEIPVSTQMDVELLKQVSKSQNSPRRKYV